MKIEAVRQNYFPFKIGDRFTVRPATRDEFRDVFLQHGKRVFPSQSQFFSLSPERQAKAKPLIDRYLVLHHEWFLIVDEKNQIAGWCCGETEDQYTFYMRSTAVLEPYRGQKIYSSFHHHFIKYLGELGYERVTSHHQATNRKILISKLKWGYAIAGFELTEHFGPIVKLVKFLVDDRRESFTRQFGQMEHL